MIIKSSENLRNNYDAFSELAHSTGQPIYITANGEGDLVLLSIEAYEKLLNATPVVKPTKNQIGGMDNMTTYVLGNVLREMYDSSPRGHQVTSIHTFSIYYARTIEEKRLSKKEILKVAALPESYQTEISKGINLAQYVDVKPEQADRIKHIEAKFR